MSTRSLRKVDRQTETDRDKEGGEERRERERERERKTKKRGTVQSTLTFLQGT